MIFLNKPSRPLFRLFLVFFKQTLKNLQQINGKKFPSSIRSWDSNSRCSVRESPPITTRPGLSPIEMKFRSLINFHFNDVEISSKILLWLPEELYDWTFPNLFIVHSFKLVIPSLFLVYFGSFDCTLKRDLNWDHWNR